jgi:hypothetical protein
MLRTGFDTECWSQGQIRSVGCGADHSFARCGTNYTSQSWIQSMEYGRFGVKQFQESFWILVNNSWKF